jgi:hypothetical protein
VYYSKQISHSYTLVLERHGILNPYRLSTSFDGGPFLLLADSEKCTVFNLNNGQHISQVKLVFNMFETSEDWDDFYFANGKLVVLPPLEEDTPIVMDSYNFC